jgi:hypothetical protein
MLLRASDRSRASFVILSLSLLRNFFRLLVLRCGERIFARYSRLATRPSGVIRAVAAARAATIPALQMVVAGEDNEAAFPIKVLIFHRLVHFDFFILSALYRRLLLTSDPS